MSNVRAFKNPFTPAKKVERKLKLLLYGAAGSGKTTLALSLSQFANGKTAFIDMEGGSGLYADLFDFDVLPTKDYQQVKAALDFIEFAQHDYDLIIVDPISVLWAVIIEAAQNAKNNMDKSLTFQDWGIIKRKMNAIYTRLVNLPLHVVVIARSKDEYEGEGDNKRRTGESPDAEKSLEYLFDIVVNLQKRGGRKSSVEKDRSKTLPAQVDSLTAEHFAKAFERVTGGERQAMQTDEEAAQSLVNEMAQPAKPANGNGAISRPYSPEILLRGMNGKIKDKAGAKADIEALKGQFAGMVELGDETKIILAITGKSALADTSQDEARVITEWLKGDANHVKAEIKMLLDSLATPAETVEGGE